MFAAMLGRSLLHNRRRVAVALASIIVPAALVTAAVNFTADARQKMRHELRQGGPNVVITGPVRPADLAAPGRIVAPRYETLRTAANGVELSVVAVDVEATRALYTSWRVEGQWPRLGCLVGIRLARLHELRPGGSFLDSIVDGIVDTGGEDDDAAFVSLQGSATEFPGRIDVSVPGSVAEVEAFARDVERRIPRAEARVQRQIAAREEAVLSKLTLAFTLVGLLVGAVCALSMATALMALVSERQSEFALLRALGMENGRLARLFFGEISVLLAAGLVAGAGAGLALSDWLGRSVFHQGTAFRPLSIVAAAAASAAIAAVAAVLPLRRTLAMDPALALKEE